VWYLVRCSIENSTRTAVTVLQSRSNASSLSPFFSPPLFLLSFPFSSLFLSREGSVSAWKELSLGGADPSIRDKRSRTAQEVAQLHGWSADGDRLDSTEHRRLMASKARKTVTAVLTHPMCVRHFTCPPSMTTNPSAPPENIRRLSVLLDKVRVGVRQLHRGRR
jgi:hypothetical protein